MNAAQHERATSETLREAVGITAQPFLLNSTWLQGDRRISDHHQASRAALVLIRGLPLRGVQERSISSFVVYQ